MKKIMALSFLFLLSQCSTLPSKKGPITDIGVWQGQVLMLNQTTKNKKWANVTWASDSKDRRLRIDVSAAVLDIPIATFLQVGDEAHLWLFTEQKYYYSADSKKLFQTLTKVHLDPEIFYSLLGEPVPPSAEWSCRDAKKLFGCRSEKQKTNLTVDHKDPDQRIISISKSPKALKIKLYRSKVEVKDEHFKMLSTPQYKTIQI